MLRLITSGGSKVDFVDIDPFVSESKYAFLRDMFEIAIKTYSKFDRATCFVRDGNHVHFVAAVGYEADELNQFHFLAECFEWGHQEPELVEYTEYQDIFESKKEEISFLRKYGQLKQSIRFNVKISDSEYAGMSFDLVESNANTFTYDDAKWFKPFQNMIANYYEFNILRRETNHFRQEVVYSLVRTLELYDTYTGSHSENVAKLCVRFARYLNLNENQVETLFWSGIVHDIGKIGLPKDVLNKPGKLTEEEMKLIRLHPTFGSDILAQSHVLTEIASIVRHHHEWWNGSGYPAGLKEEQIPYLSRILHICDAVDAMSNNRVYRSKMTLDEIIIQLKEKSGIQFDPTLSLKMIEYLIEHNL